MVVLTFLMVSLPLSLFSLGLASFLLLALWIAWDWDFKQIRRFFASESFGQAFIKTVKYLASNSVQGIKTRTMAFYKNKPALVFSLLFFIPLFGLLNTSDFSYGLREIRVAIPLLFFPLLFTGLPKINNKLFRILLLFYLAGIFVSTLFSANILFRDSYTDIRQISPFIASIRFGLNLTLSIFIIVYFLIKDTFFSPVQKTGLLLLALWFLTVLFFLESVTSFAILLIVGLAVLIYQVFHSKKLLLKISFGLLFILIPSGIYFYLRTEIIRYETPPVIQASQLDKFTAEGHPYTFDTIHRGVEDGKYTGLYLCLPELKKAWNQRSKMPFSGMDNKNQPLSETLIRYLTSKNLRKDAEGVAALTPIDVERIENGVANYNYVAHPGIHSRLMKIIKGYEVYQKTGNPSGNSMIQRWVYMKASLNIIKQYFWSGVGTGDVQAAFVRELQKMDTGLKYQFMHLAHNQFLEAFVAFGIFGFLFYVFALLYPPIATHAFRNSLFAVFYALMILSMFSDTTLETPDGVFLFAFFSNLLLFGKEHKKLYHN